MLPFKGHCHPPKEGKQSLKKSTQLWKSWKSMTPSPLPSTSFISSMRWLWPKMSSTWPAEEQVFQWKIGRRTISKSPCLKTQRIFNSYFSIYFDLLHVCIWNNVVFYYIVPLMWFTGLRNAYLLSTCWVKSPHFDRPRRLTHAQVTRGRTQARQPCHHGALVSTHPARSCHHRSSEWRFLQLEEKTEKL